MPKTVEGLTLRFVPTGELRWKVLRAWQSEFTFRLAKELGCLILLFDDWITTKRKSYRAIEALIRESRDFEVNGRENDIWHSLRTASGASEILNNPLQPCDYVLALVDEKHRSDFSGGNGRFDEERHSVAIITTAPKHTDLKVTYTTTTNWKDGVDLVSSVNDALKATTPPFDCRVILSAELEIDRDRA